ncbi:MAG TPA: endonuclease/exonuclease/phosphatase family protein [Polyangiaceae bacterium]|nr:endonuclease/exonuclease/phosphatase family protein [Polyangiaceae bacterium]
MKRSTARLLILFGLSLGAMVSARSRHASSRVAEPHVVARIPESSPWSSPEACEREVSAGHRAQRPPGSARLGAWNVRWFPDGNPGRPKHGGPGPEPTDVRWLACTIAWMDVDVLALEEVKASPSAATALTELRSRLDALTGGAHHVEVDRCPGNGRQSVALLWDESRVHGEGFRNLDSLNPNGSACDEHLRPGFTGYFRYPGGADFHFVAVHLKSGEAEKDLALRGASLRGIPQAFRDLQTTAPDADVLLAGDFNTMGCLDCRPKVRAGEELAVFGPTLAALPVPFREVESPERCSEYYRGEGQLLDHFVASASMQEVPVATRAHVDGYCAAVACARQDPHAMPRAYRELSDHCPVLLDVRNQDVD